MSWGPWLIAVVIALALVAVAGLTVAVLVWRRQRALVRRLDRGPAARVGDDVYGQPADDRAAGPLVAFVVNPTKNGSTELREQALRACAERYLPEPLWLETSAQDPGIGQARAALEHGADVVVAAGGDGTVRGVAEALAGTGVPMGLIPLGTGNLFARNLDLPLTDRDELLRIALTGTERAVDVGWVDVERPGGSHDDCEYLFLVIAGLGFDAQMVAGADEDLKKRWGWAAYFVAGVSHLNGRRLRVRIDSDDGERVETLRLRTVLFGNCGRLPGGITLLPDAVIDDGWLDIAAIDTRGGLVGWGQLFTDVLLQGIGIRNKLPARIGRIDHSRARTVHARVSDEEEVQVDGETLGRAVAVRARLDHRGLVVRVPDPAA